MPDEKEASFRILKVEDKDAEPISATRKSMVDALKGMKQGEPVLGAIGTVLEPSSESEPETLTDKEKVFKRTLIAFLLKYLDPPEMGSKFKPAQAHLVLRKKLEKQTLGELKRFWGKKVLPSDEEITEDDKEELRRKWVDISP